MSTVLINDEYLHDIADSIRKMKRTSNPITTDSMAGEIEGIDIGYDPDEKWERPLDWPDYSQIDITNFEGMYFTYDTSQADNATEWAGFYCVCSGGYKVERGQIINGEFVAEQTTTKSSGSEFREWIPMTVTGYVVYRITASTGNPITSIGMRDLPRSMTGSDTTRLYSQQKCLERYGRLPNITSFSSWQNNFVRSDTIYNLEKLTSFYCVWANCFLIENIDLTGFNSNVTNCQSAFASCKSLRYINNTDKFVTSACRTMYQIFYNCPNVRFIDSGAWDTSNVTNMQQAFDTCQSLYKLDVSGWDTAKVTTFYTTFANTQKVPKLDVSNFDTSKATTFYGMFSGCYRVEELDVSNFNTELGTSMSYMFANMPNLKQLDLSNFRTPNVTTMAYMFVGCKALSYLDISNFDTSKVTTMLQMFYNCGALKNLDISHFDYSSCTNFSDFMDIGTYTQSDIGFDSTTATAAITNINWIFMNNYCIKELDLSGMNLSNVTKPTSGFRYCYNIEKIKLPNSLHSIGDYFFDNCRNLKKIVLPSTTLVTLATTNAFGNRNDCQLTIYVPDNLVSSYQAATNWKSLTYVTFAGLSTYTD